MRRADTSRFDLLRGFSGAEKLAFSPNLHRFITSTAGSVLTSLVGCPAEVFIAIGDTLAAGKKFRAQEVDVEEFQGSLNQVMAHLQNWDPLTALYPSADAEWMQLADAYRHTAMLRVHRFPNTFLIPCSDVRIKASVDAILDVSARIPRQSRYFKRLLFPLFVAGADTASPHQQQYVLMCIGHIEEMTGVTYHSVLELLKKTWEDRGKADGVRNVPWFEYVRIVIYSPPAATADKTQTCSDDLPRQHDFLFF